MIVLAAKRKFKSINVDISISKYLNSFGHMGITQLVYCVVDMASICG